MSYTLFYGLLDNEFDSTFYKGFTIPTIIVEPQKISILYKTNIFKQDSTFVVSCPSNCTDKGPQGLD